MIAFDDNGGGQDRSAVQKHIRDVAADKTNDKGDSMLSKRIVSVLLPTGLWFVSCNTSAQVVNIGFGQNIATPLSLWTAGGAAVLLASAAWALLRRKRGMGLLLLAITAFAGVVTSQTQEANALVACTGLTQPIGTRVGCLTLTAPSPNVTTDYGFPPLLAFIDVTNAVGAPVTITDIQVSGPGLWGIITNPTDSASLTAFAPVCAVGLTLPTGGRCSLYLHSFLAI